MTVNAVVIGYGFAGKNFHSYLVNKCAHINLYGVMCRNAQQREEVKRENPTIQTFSSLEEALDDEKVNLVIIATPPSTHFPFAEKALQKRKNVVVGKFTFFY